MQLLPSTIPHSAAFFFCQQTTNIFHTCNLSKYQLSLMTYTASDPVSSALTKFLLSYGVVKYSQLSSPKPIAKHTICNTLLSSHTSRLPARGYPRSALQTVAHTGPNAYLPTSTPNLRTTQSKRAASHSSRTSNLALSLSALHHSGRSESGGSRWASGRD